MKNSILFFFVANLMLLFYVDGIDEIPQEHQIMIDENPYRILGIGDACMDLLIPVEEDFLAHVPGEKGGSQPISPEELNKILEAAPTAPYIATGGSGANTIKGLAALNEKCAFLSLTGRDSLGEQFSNYLKKWGILGLFTQSHLSTTVVLCLITPDGQRTMRFSAGCSVELSDQLLHADYFKNTDLIHLDAYTLRRDQLTERTIFLAKEAQAKVSIDLSSFEIIREFHARILNLLPQIDIVFANEMEVKELTGLEPYEACVKLQELCPIAVVLLGKNGCLVGHQGIILHSHGFPADVVDTTGAGDLFASGFLYGYLKGYSLDYCARMGNRLGSAIIEVTGAELPPEKWESVKMELHEILLF